MLTTHYESKAPYPHVWNIAVDGVVVWTQTKMFAPAEIKALVETFCKAAT